MNKRLNYEITTRARFDKNVVVITVVVGKLADVGYVLAGLLAAGTTVTIKPTIKPAVKLTPAAVLAHFRVRHMLQPELFTNKPED